MVWYKRTLQNAGRSRAKGKLFSWSVPGNPIKCEVPKKFEENKMEISVTWGISPGYTLSANLVDAKREELDMASIEIERFQRIQELEKKFPELFPLEGTFYIM